MRIILVVADSSGRNLVFVSDALRAYSLEDAAKLAKDGKLEGVYPVNRRGNVYLRTKSNTAKKDNLERISISSFRLFSFPDNSNYALTTPAFNGYWLEYLHSLKEQGGPFIFIEGTPRIIKDTVKEKLQQHKDLIFEAAKKFDVDPYLLGAIIIDEIAQLKPFEEIFEKLAVFFIGKNASAGIAQVKMDTARGLIRDGYYNPNPDDPKLSKDKIQKTSRYHLHTYVVQSRHSVFFAAAEMRYIIDTWRKYIDISKSPDIIATLYSLRKNPHPHPRPNERGLQIANEFYKLAKQWLQ